MEEAGREGLDGKSGRGSGRIGGEIGVGVGGGAGGGCVDGGSCGGAGRWRRCNGGCSGGGSVRVAAAAQGRQRCQGGGGNNGILVAGARSGGSTKVCGGGGGDSGWTPSPIFREQPLEREKTPLFSQMIARVCGGGGPFPSYRAQNGPRGERAHLWPTTQSLNMIIEIKRFTKKKGFTNRIPKREEPSRKPKRKREISEDPLKHVQVEKFIIKKEDKSMRVKGLLRRRDIVSWWRWRSYVTNPPGVERTRLRRVGKRIRKWLQRSDHSHSRSASEIHASSSGGWPDQWTMNLHETPSPEKTITSRKISSTRLCRSGGNAREVDIKANSLSTNRPVGEGLTSDERGGAGCDVRSITWNVEQIPHDGGMSTT